MLNKQITNTSELTALELVKFICSKNMNQHTIKEMAEELDSNKRLVSEIIYFLQKLAGLEEIQTGLM